MLRILRYGLGVGVVWGIGLGGKTSLGSQETQIPGACLRRIGGGRMDCATDCETDGRTCLRHADAPAFSVFSIPCIPCFPDLVVIDDAALRLGCNKVVPSIGFSDCQIGWPRVRYRVAAVRR